MGSHFNRSASSILNDFQSGKVESLSLGDYTYKPVASRPGKLGQAQSPSGLDKMEPLQEARKSATLDLTPAQRAEGEAAKAKAVNMYHHPENVARRKRNADPGDDNYPPKDFEGHPIRKAADENAQEWALFTDGKRGSGYESESVANDYANRLRKEGKKVEVKRIPKSTAPTSQGTDTVPIRKAADDFSHEEWTGLKPLDKPAPDREKFLQTGEVTPEASQKQTWWNRMKERLKFKRSDTEEDKKADEAEAQRLADEQKQEHLGRLIRREKLPGYDAWRLASPDDRPIKKSAGEQLEKCVHEVKRKDGSVNPFAVCHESTGE